MRSPGLHRLPTTPGASGFSGQGRQAHSRLSKLRAWKLPFSPFLMCRTCVHSPAMHAESGVNGVGTPIGAPTWPPCVAVSAGRAQVSGAHEPSVLGSQPMSGPGPQASTVPPPVTRQPASARAASLVPNISTSARMAPTTLRFGEGIRQQKGRVRIPPSALIPPRFGDASSLSRRLSPCREARDESVHPVLDFGQVVGRGAAPRLDLGESHREANVGTRQAGGRDGLSLRERRLVTPQLCIRLLPRRLQLSSRALL